MKEKDSRGIHPAAIGAAVTDETTEAWVQFCIRAGEEAHAAVLQNPPTITIASSNDPHMRLLLGLGDAMSRDDHAKYGAKVTHNAEEYDHNGRTRTRPMDGEEMAKASEDAAATAFRCCMPQLTGRRRAQAYFACVAAGLQRGYFKGAEAKAMLHSAQLALNAFPKRQQKPRLARRIEHTEP